MAEKKKITGKCKGCQAEIVWLKSHVSGKNVPVNPEGVEADDVFFNFKKHVSHFATCIYAKELRKNGKGTKGSVKNALVVGELPTVAEIIKEGVKVSAEFREKLAGDKRLFILHNKHNMTVWRYSLLNICADQGMEYESLVNFDNRELQDWLADLSPASREQGVGNNEHTPTVGEVTPLERGIAQRSLFE